ncbi:MAG TPA: type VI secretion system Vgr family protein, partial [Pseudoduganella sp.]
MDSALLSFFQQDKDLVTENRPLRLRLAHPTQMLEDVLLPQRVDGSESICGSIEYRILCVSLDAFIPLKELIALPIAVDIVTDRGDLRSVCGIVTEARAGDSDGGLASYQLVLRDALSIMEKRNNTRVFRNKNEVEIVQVILDEWLQTNPIIGTCFRYEMVDSFRVDAYPQREFTMQYNESDAAFIRRLLKRRGIAWYFRADQSNSPSHTMVLFDNADTLPLNAAGVVRYHRDAATEERDAITSWCAVRTLQPGSVSRFSWNYKNPQGSEFMTMRIDGRSDQGPNGNEMSASLDDYLVLSPHAGDDHDDLCQLGQLAMNRHDLESKCFHGEGSVRDFCAGEYFELENHPQIDAHSKGDREFVITAMQIRASNNFSKALVERMDRLFSQNRWTSNSEEASARTRVRITFTVVRRGIPIVPTFDVDKDLPDIPMQSAIVVGPEGEEVYCDELGRVKIRFRTTRAEDHEHAQGAGAAEKDYDSAWVRVASNWAGNGPGGLIQCGSLHIPRVGSEVLVSFLGGDPDRPVIVAQLFNEIGLPPALGAQRGLPQNRFIAGVRSREVNGSRSNRMTFDDTESEIGAQFGSDHGESMLRMGFLTTPREQGIGKARGEGIELTTAHQTALRAASGLLVTTWAQLDVSGRHMAADEFRQLIAACHGLIEDLSAAAEERQAESSDCSTLDCYEEAINDWGAQSEAPSSAPIAISAVDGLGIATPKGISGYAGQNYDIAAAGNVQATSGAKIVLNAADNISLFAEKSGIKVIAGAGKLVLQSQGDDTEVHSAKGVRIAANDGPLSCTAKEVLLTAEDGSFIKIGNGITFGCRGTMTFHGAKFDFKKPKTMQAKFQASAKRQEKKRSLIVELVDADGGFPEGEQLKLVFPGTGQSKSGMARSGKAKLSGLPNGQFKLVQPKRR